MRIYFGFKCTFFTFILFIFIIFKYKYLHLSQILLPFNNEKYKLISRKLNRQDNINDAVLLMIPHHGNLGDQAISLAEMKFLKEILPNITMIYDLENYKKYIHDNTIIFLHGGGNIGWTYPFEEENRRKIIKSFPNNTIIILPQTIYFEETYKNQQKFSIEIYSNHSKLIIITREKVSFDIANNIFKKNKIFLMPDIVTYLDDLINFRNINRKGALILFRNDTEKNFNVNIENQIISIIKKNYNECEISDTQFKNLYIKSINQSKGIVTKLLKNISQHEIVVTDRLHGMIFCIITETSCIVMNNYNHKISSSYEWFKHLDYIKMVNNNDIKRFQNLIYYFKNKKHQNRYDKNYFEKYYNIFRKIVLNKYNLLYKVY